ncbi:MAG: YihY/virulence factor BrkB family protein [Acidobacteriota bacterium]|jgi:membrane protein
MRKSGSIAGHKLRFAPYPAWSEVGLIAREVWKKIWFDEIFGRAAQLAFFWFLSLLPFLIFLTALASLLQQEVGLTGLIAESGNLLPTAASNLLVSTLNHVNSRHHQGLLSFSLLAMVWAASAGMEAIITSLNRAYATNRTRPWWREKILAVLLTIGFGLFFFGAIILFNFSELISRETANYFNFGRAFLATWAVVKWPLMMLFVLFGLELIYFFAPDCQQRWQIFTPGTIFALLFWLVISYGFRLYVMKFSNFDLTYGALGGVMIFLLWLYLTGVAILVGGEINSALRE